MITNEERIYELKLQEGYCYIRDIIILYFIALLEMLGFMVLSIFIWYNYTSTFTTKQFLVFYITIGILIELIIYCINGRFIKWFKRCRVNWIRREIRKIHKS